MAARWAAIFLGMTGLLYEGAGAAGVHGSSIFNPQTLANRALYRHSVAKAAAVGYAIGRGDPDV